MSDLKPNSKVSLEELLRLKRGERPDAQFWVTFERELRQKQLTALVQKRRWWHDLSLVLGRRMYIPAGAAAAMAIGLVAVRYAAPVASVPTAPRSIAVASEVAIPELPTVEVDYQSLPAAARAEVASVPSDSAPRRALVGRDVSDEVGLLPVARVSQESSAPSSQTIAANLADLEQSEPELVKAVIGNRIAAATPQAQNASMEDQTAAPKKYRLIARYAERALDPNPVAPASYREKLARKLGADLVGDFSRVAVERGAVSVRF